MSYRGAELERAPGSLADLRQQLNSGAMPVGQVLLDLIQEGELTPQRSGSSEPGEVLDPQAPPQPEVESIPTTAPLDR